MNKTKSGVREAAADHFLENQSNAADAKNQNRLENCGIERGNAMRVYEGMDFKRRRPYEHTHYRKSN
jgi:hypothetical protein